MNNSYPHIVDNNLVIDLVYSQNPVDKTGFGPDWSRPFIVECVEEVRLETLHNSMFHLAAQVYNH